MEYFLLGFKNYANFKGRARRKEYWMFVLFQTLFGLGAMVLDNITGMAMEGIGYGPIYLIYTLVIIIPSLSISVRRLHDIGKSGWMLLVSMVPIIGSIWLLILLVKQSDENVNNYGPSHLETEVGDFISKA